MANLRDDSFHTLLRLIFGWPGGWLTVVVVTSEGLTKRGRWKFLWVSKMGKFAYQHTNTLASSCKLQLCMCECVCMCACACVRVCVRVCVRARARLLILDFRARRANSRAWSIGDGELIRLPPSALVPGGQHERRLRLTCIVLGSRNARARELANF